MIEIRYPGVFVTEVAFDAHAIDGVPTSAPAAPEWTAPNAHDPGTTLVQLFAFTTESLLFRAAQSPERTATAGRVAAERSGAALLIDEAEALLGRRTEVRDSHDRYADRDVKQCGWQDSNRRPPGS